MAKTSVKFQNDRPKTVGGVALKRHPLYIVDERTNGWITARLYRPANAGATKKRLCHKTLNCDITANTHSNTNADADVRVATIAPSTFVQVSY